MPYLQIYVGEASYHGSEALTYASSTEVGIGTLVAVPLRNKLVVGVVAREVTKPLFPVKKIESVSDITPLPKQLLQLLEWIIDYYPAPLGIITQLFLPRSLPKKPEQAATSPNPPNSALPSLTSDQTNALQHITQPGLHLLHGQTGSGKTRVYIELAKRQRDKGKSTLLLSPEIGLTSQLVSDFRSVFGDALVELWHSDLTETVKQKTWARIATTSEPIIVIGARSALFTPIKNLGLVVVDESHETTYKQDQAPYYHANTIAARLAALHQAILVLGSATPSVSDYFIAQAKNRPIIQMRHTASQTNMADSQVKIVDLRDKQAFTKSRCISDTLINAIQATLDRQEQTLLFLNRRGTARLIFCDQCTWQALCPHCDVALVYHGDSHKVRCHTCGYHTKAPMSCPLCNNPSIIFSSIGTKALEDEVNRIFPEAITKRFDSDNKRAEKIENIYKSVREGGVNILVGTQTIAKGLDLPHLSLVGVMTADNGLSFPDFSAQERTFQLLSQVLGRVGRGHRSSMAIVQTYNPENPILQAALKKDWYNFYNNEINERCDFLFPPFCYILKLTCKRQTAENAKRAASRLAQIIAHTYKGIVLEGPTPSFREKIGGKYQWQIVIKAKQRRLLLDIVADLPSQWSYDIDPINLL